MRNEIQEKIKSSHKTQVNLANMKITDDEIQEIVSKIKELRPAIDSVFLNYNKISDKGAKILASEFKTLPHLKFMDLQFNQIDEEGAFELLLLKENHPELSFALHGNKIVEISKMLDIEKRAEAVINKNKRSLV